jgi:ribosomal protein L11 methyltransferase
VLNSDESTRKPRQTEWSLVEFVTTTADSELLSDLLWSLGVVAIEELTEDDTHVVLRTSVGEHPTAAIERVQQMFPSVQTRSVFVPRSVADTWRQHATPTWITDRVVLVPAWREAPADSEAIYIEPADTFGLGNHPTTVLALRLALLHTSQGATVFDLGCGSGVLGIALAKTHQCQVSMYDIADGAQWVVEENCHLNNVATVSWSPWPTFQKHDVVLANILAPVLTSEANAISTAMKLGGVLVLSGMRDEQVNNVLKHYEGFTELSRDTQDGWTAVALTSPSK